MNGNPRHPTRAFLVLFLVVATGAGAWDWPGGEISIIDGFGSIRFTEVQPGMRLTMGAQEPPALHPGTLLYALEADDPLSPVPSALGAYAVVGHEGGFQTIYGNLAGRPAEGPGDEIVRLPAPLDGRLYLAVLDDKLGRWVNPVQLLPERPDVTAPRIDSVLLQGESGDYSLQRRTTVPPGVYRLVVRTVDPVGTGRLRAELPPFALRVWEGDLARELVFDGIDPLLHRLGTRNGRRIAETFGTDGGYALGDLTVGAATEVSLLVEVVDYAGNRTTRSYTLVAEAAAGPSP